MLLWLALKGGILHYFAMEAIYLEMNLLVINLYFFYIIILNLPPRKCNLSRKESQKEYNRKNISFKDCYRKEEQNRKLGSEFCEFLKGV